MYLLFLIFPFRIFGRWAAQQRVEGEEAARAELDAALASQRRNPVTQQVLPPPPLSAAAHQLQRQRQRDQRLAEEGALGAAAAAATAAAGGRGGAAWGTVAGEAPGAWGRSVPDSSLVLGPQWGGGQSGGQSGGKSGGQSGGQSGGRGGRKPRQSESELIEALKLLST